MGGWVDGRVDGWGHVKLLKILFEDLWFVERPPALDGCWVGSLVGSCQIPKIQINLDLIKKIQFCLNIYDLWRHPHLWVGGWMVEWMDDLMRRSCQITSYWINLDLIEIILFCLQIYDLWRYLYAYTTHWSQWLVIEIMSIIYSPTVSLFENWHIMYNCQFWTFFWHFDFWLLT